MRIVPRLNEGVNEEWISDKARFQYDGLKRQRLSVPLVKGPDGFHPVAWPDALKAVADRLATVKGNEIKGIAGKLADAESMIALKVGTGLDRTGIFVLRTFRGGWMVYHKLATSMCGFS